MGTVLVDDLGGHRQAYLNLEFEISRPYYAFVFEDMNTARVWQETAFGQPGCEFAPPWARVMLVDAALAGLFAAIPGVDLQGLRLVSSVRMLRNSGSIDPATRTRLRLAAQASIQPDADDFFLSRIGIERSMRGRGLGSWLLNEVIGDARRRGMKRCVLEVDPDNTTAVALYSGSGFTVIDEHVVTDRQTGRGYARLWMGRALK